MQEYLIKVSLCDLYFSVLTINGASVAFDNSLFSTHLPFHFCLFHKSISVCEYGAPDCFYTALLCNLAKWYLHSVYSEMVNSLAGKKGVC